jgi:hypothetical protein
MADKNQVKLLRMGPRPNQRAMQRKSAVQFAKANGMKVRGFGTKRMIIGAGGREG